MGRLLFIFSTLALLAIVIAGLIWIFALSASSPVGFAWYLFSFAAGLSMIVLPCTLPLAFVIVPMSMGKGYAKGLGTALMFGLGVAITLSMYGILAAILGKAVFSFSGGGGETIKGIFYSIAGIIAILFALGELGLIKFRLPSYGGAAPAIIQKRQDLLKPLLLGLFLGNIGVGCPHPATPIILGQIGIVGDVFYGWLLFFVHAIGRVIPLIVLAMFGIMGVNAIKILVAHKDSIARATAWGMVFVGAFLFTLGFFSHDWWVLSGTHSLFEEFTQEQRFTSILSERFEVSAPHSHGLEELEGKTGFFGAPLWLGNWVLVALWIIPMWGYWFYKRRRLQMPEAPEGDTRRALRWQGAFIFAFSLLLALVFIHVIPHRFLGHKALETMEMKAKAPQSEVILKTNPESPIPGTATELTFSLKDESGKPITGLKIEHERILHVQVISEDFQVFSHIHPEDAGPITEQMIQSATFSINYIFPKSGRYLIAVGYMHDTHNVTKKFFIDVGERGISFIQKDFAREKWIPNIYNGGYYVYLTTDPSEIVSGRETVLRYRIANGARQPVEDLEPYLAAPLHLAVISADLSSYQHIHGEIHDPITGEGKHELKIGERFGPDIEAHIVFPFPGLYQVFAEFQHQGNVVVASFMLEIGAGSNKLEVMDEVHGH